MGPAVEPSVAAGPGEAMLSWEAPPECPTREQVIAAVDAVLSESTHEGRGDVVADGRLQAVQEGYMLTLRIRSPSGERTRELSAASCGELGEIAALLVAIAIDPAAASVDPTPVPPEPARADEPDPVAPPPDLPPARPPDPPAEVAPPRAATEPRQQRELQFSLVAGVGLSLGVLASPSAAVSLGGALRFRALRAELAAVHRVVRPVRAPAADAGADLWSTAGLVELCGVPSVPRVEFPLCAGVEGGTLAGRGHDVSVPRTGRSPWLAVRAGGGITALAWRRVGFGVSARALVPTIRPTFEIEGVGEVHTAGPIAGEVTGIVEVRFP